MENVRAQVQCHVSYKVYFLTDFNISKRFGGWGGVFNQMIFVESINKKDSHPIGETKAIQSYKKC